MTTLQQELKELRTNPSLEVKGRITDKITKLYNADAFLPEEKLQADEIIKLLVAKSITSIKEIIANNLKYNTEIGRDIIMQLAQDVEQIAVPVLECSPLLTNQDLIYIVRSAENENAICAVAKRHDIREELSETIVMRNFTKATATLLDNASALIPESAYHFILGHNQDNSNILAKIANRNELPIEVVNMVITYASAEIKQQLLARYPANSSNHKETVRNQKLRMITEHQVGMAKHSLVNDILQDAQAKTIIASVEDLATRNELDYNLAVKALCSGNLLFFTFALGKLAQQSYKTSYDIVFSEGAGSFASLYKAAGMPNSIYEAVATLLKLTLEAYPDGQVDTKQFSSVIIAEILRKGYDYKVKMMPELMAIISQS